MNRIALFALVASLSLASYAGDSGGYSGTVTNRIKVLSKTDSIPFDVLSVQPWVAATAFTNGAGVGNGGFKWMCLTPGQSDDAGGPTGSVKVFSETGGVRWVKSIGSKRTGWAIRCNSGGTITIGYENTITNGGTPEQVLSGDLYIGDGTYQGPVFIVATNGGFSASERSDR